MGIVYRARHLPTDRYVALKVIRTERQANAKVIRRFRREAQAAMSEVPAPISSPSMNFG